MATQRSKISMIKWQRQNQAKDQLNTARQGLTLDRQPALTTLHGASNLNQAQQNNFTQQINAAQIMLHLKRSSLTLQL